MDVRPGHSEMNTKNTIHNTTTLMTLIIINYRRNTCIKTQNHDCDLIVHKTYLTDEKYIKLKVDSVVLREFLF